MSTNHSGFYTRLVSLTILLLFTSSAAATRAPAWSKEGMAATPHPAATAAAVEILRAGGNAVDATVCAAFVLSVVEPYHSGLGGGEFALLRFAKDGRVRVLDARESAPLASTPDMYIDPATGEPHSTKSQRGGLAVGVPGSVAGRIELIEKYGNLPLKKVLAPAVSLARNGFRIDRVLAARIKSSADYFAENAHTANVFLKNNQPPERGELLIQKRLADTIEKIATDRGASFYHGRMAEAIVKADISEGGILTASDLASYRFIWREPIRFTYRNFEIYSMPPPSSGGICLAEILNILEAFPIDYLPQGGAESYHIIASAFERAFADRSKWLGDGDFNPIPVEGLTSRQYADKLREDINRNWRVKVDEAGDPWIFDQEGNTSHISVIDAAGNMCSMTTSINGAFGSRVYVPELGIFLNNTMDDFSLAPSVPNQFDLIGGDINGIAPGKRPLSSMSPTLVLEDGEPFMALGSVGGPKIITSVAQTLINVIDYRMDVQAAIDAPRIHMQWRPDKLSVEAAVPPEVTDNLRIRGWSIDQKDMWSLTQAVMFDRETRVFYGASDSRGVGSAGPENDR